MSIFHNRYVLKDGTVIMPDEINIVRRWRSNWWITLCNGAEHAVISYRTDRPTGMVDSTGKEIFERDIVLYGEDRGVIKCSDTGAWWLKDDFGAFALLYDAHMHLTITGMVPFGEET
jgi:hypothetical protein